MGKKDRSKRKEVGREERPFSDSGRYSIDSFKLRYLIAGYRWELQRAEKKGLKIFWDRALKLNKENLKLESGVIVDRISQEEMSLLEDAKNGSIKAIQKLIEASPGIIELPFVSDKMIEILYK